MSAEDASYSLRVPSDPALGVAVRTFVRSSGAALGLPEIDVETLSLAATELLANAVEAREPTLEMTLAAAEGRWTLRATGVGPIRSVDGEEIDRRALLSGLGDVQVDPAGVLPAVRRARLAVPVARAPSSIEPLYPRRDAGNPFGLAVGGEHLPSTGRRCASAPTRGNDVMEAAEILRPSGSLSASEPGGRPRTARFRRGRVCASDGCATVLSSYNPDECCWIHTEPHPKIALGRRPAEVEGPRVLSPPEELGLIQSLVGSHPWTSPGAGARAHARAAGPTPAEPAARAYVVSEVGDEGHRLARACADRW